MLKTQRRFCLDRKYKGPFVIKSVTSTNVIIQLMDNNTAEELYVYHCVVVKCHIQPHGWSIRERDILYSQGLTVETQWMTQSEAATVNNGTRISSRGRQNRTPERFLLADSPKAKQRKVGGCRN